jgi:hypothetical protein
MNVRKTISRQPPEPNPRPSLFPPQALRSLFSAGTDSPITTALAAQLTNALFDYMPSPNESKLYALWIDVLGKGAVLLARCANQLVFVVGLVCFVPFVSHVQCANQLD